MDLVPRPGPQDTGIDRLGDKAFRHPILTTATALKLPSISNTHLSAANVHIHATQSRNLSASLLSAASSNKVPRTLGLNMDEGSNPGSSTDELRYEDASMYDPRATAMAAISTPEVCPGWTTRWTARAPPPRPLKMLTTAGTSGNMTMVSTGRRHHPYAASHHSGPPSRGGATPSPTWPPHIGLDDHDVKPSSLPSQAAQEGTLFTGAAYNDADSGNGRGRSSTVILPHPACSVRRPWSTMRTLSYGYPSGLPRRDRSDSTASSSQYFDGSRRSQGDSIASSSMMNAESYGSTNPSSPLLFTPITPQSDVLPTLYYNSPGNEDNQCSASGGVEYAFRGARWQSGHHVHTSSPPISTGSRPLGASSPLHPVLNHDDIPRTNVLRLSLHEPARKPKLEADRRSSQGQVVSKPARVALEGWQTLPSVEKPLPLALGPTVTSTHQPVLERLSQSRRRRRPPYSYSSLIAQAISSAPGGRMTLREIYTWISNAYPQLYSMDGPDSQGWQNTVRHNLSLNKSFVKVARTAQDIYDSCASPNPAHSQAARGKGGWWTIDPVVAAAQLGPNFRGLEHQAPGVPSAPIVISGGHGPREGSPGDHSDEYSNGSPTTPSGLLAAENATFPSDSAQGWTSSYPVFENRALAPQKQARHRGSVDGREIDSTLRNRGAPIGGVFGRHRGYTTTAAELGSTRAACMLPIPRSGPNFSMQRLHVHKAASDDRHTITMAPEGVIRDGSIEESKDVYKGITSVPNITDRDSAIGGASSRTAGMSIRDLLC